MHLEIRAGYFMFAEVHNFSRHSVGHEATCVKFRNYKCYLILPILTVFRGILITHVAQLGAKENTILINPKEAKSKSQIVFSGDCVGISIIMLLYFDTL